ncbi:MAG: PLP-dependent aminotransferase family protein [Desulfovibrionales bacterium]|nr:PLP-dependent aminotransferase family protein [Desulfovibrionales bacterium]
MKEYKYQNIEQYLTDLIESGRFAVGQKLPSLRDVSRKMAVSLATATHAYLELEKKGLIEARPRSGYYVRQQVSYLPIPETPVQQIEVGKISRVELIHTVLASVGNTQMLPFGCVCPDNSLLPHKAMARIVADVLRESSADALGYETILGNDCLRRQVGWRMQEYGCRVTGNDILVTNGAMEALYLALRSTVSKGDCVVIQSPTYYCFLQLLENMGVKTVEVPSSPTHGVRPRDLEEAFSRFDVAACILSPNFNNPDGALTPDAVKEEVLDICAAHNVPLIEDDVYGDLSDDQTVRPKPYKAFDTKGRVIHCSSFSKTIAPGFRVGYMAPGQYYQKAVDIKATTNVSCPSITQQAVARYLEAGGYDRHLRKLRNATQNQRTIIQNHLPEFFPKGTRVTQPEGGNMLWIAFPQQVDGTRMFFDARDKGISIAPGSIFSPNEFFTNYIRLSCAGFWNDAMRDGLRTLGMLAQRQIDEG